MLDVSVIFLGTSLCVESLNMFLDCLLKVWKVWLVNMTFQFSIQPHKPALLGLKEKYVGLRLQKQIVGDFLFLPLKQWFLLPKMDLFCFEMHVFESPPTKNFLQMLPIYAQTKKTTDRETDRWTDRQMDKLTPISPTSNVKARRGRGIKYPYYPGQYILVSPVYLAGDLRLEFMTLVLSQGTRHQLLATLDQIQHDLADLDEQFLLFLLHGK